MTESRGAKWMNVSDPFRGLSLLISLLSPPLTHGSTHIALFCHSVPKRAFCLRNKAKMIKTTLDLEGRSLGDR